VGDPIWMKFRRLVPTAVTVRRYDKNVIWQKSKPEVEFQYGGRLIFQTGNSYISAVDWIITAKFGLLIDADSLKRMTSQIRNRK